MFSAVSKRSAFDQVGKPTHDIIIARKFDHYSGNEQLWNLFYRKLIREETILMTYKLLPTARSLGVTIAHPFIQTH